MLLEAAESLKVVVVVFPDCCNFRDTATGPSGGDSFLEWELRLAMNAGHTDGRSQVFPQRPRRNQKNSNELYDALLGYRKGPLPGLVPPTPIARSAVRFGKLYRVAETTPSPNQHEPQRQSVRRRGLRVLHEDLKYEEDNVFLVVTPTT
jgi:hypothetical protein